ncbi:MAG: T9SS type A sorting domain-containing protein, partial [FCB group bacterium]|nr:T9SS type A sorting domain-containing protein [FCB group bacterium]
PTYNVAQVKAFPNPFVIENGNEYLSFNVGKKGRVRIFNVAGEQIRDMPLQPWYGKNQKGETVAAGVYLFIITDNDGNMGKGKILLIRK